MRESRARNLPPSSDEEDDDLHKKPSALDLGVFTQYSADQDGGDDSSALNPNNNILASNQDTSSDDDSAARDDIDGQGPVVFEAVAGRNCDSQRSNRFWNALSVGNTQEVASILIDVKQERFENGEYVPPVDPRQYQQFQWQNNNVPPVHGLTDSDRAAAMVQDPSLLPPPLPTLNQQPVAWTQQPLNWSPEQLTDRIEAFDQQHGLVNQQAPRQVYHNPYRTSRPSSQVPILPRPPPNRQAPPPRTEVTPPIRQVPPPRPQVPPTNHQVPPPRPQVLPPPRPQVPPQDNQDSLLNHQVPPPNVQEPSLPLPPPQNQEQDSPEELGRASVSPPDQQDAGNGPSMDDAEDSAAAIAHALETDGLALDPEDAEFLGTVKRGKNSTDYIRRQEMVEEKVFDTIKKYGGTAMQVLLEKVRIGHPNSQGDVEDYRFYRILRGPKNQAKWAILNKVFIACVLTWKNKDDVHLQPSTFTQYMKLFGYVLAWKGVAYKYDLDFNGKKEFHGVAITHWENIRKEDPTFGTGVNVAEFVKDYDKAIREAITRGDLKPYEDPKDCRAVVMWCLGRNLALRGKMEHANMYMDQCYMGRYGEDDGPRLNEKAWFGYRPPKDKTHQVNFKRPRTENLAQTLLTFVEDQNDLVLNAHHLVSFYLTKCHPHAQKFYAKTATKKQREQWKEEFGRDIWYCPSEDGKANFNYGHNNFPKEFKRLARLCGAPEADMNKCTGHGVQAYAITVAVQKGMHPLDIAAFVRHGSTNPQKYYARDTNERQANIAFGIQYDGNRCKKSSPPPRQPARIFQDNQRLQRSSGRYESPSDDTGSVSTYSASPGYMHGHYYHQLPYGYQYQQPYPPPQYNPYGFGYPPAGYAPQVMPPPPPPTPTYAAYGPVYPSHGMPPPPPPNPYAGPYPPQGMMPPPLPPPPSHGRRSSSSRRKSKSRSRSKSRERENRENDADDRHTR
jgi:hypothetical protein